jgi:Methyltransferase FkbM domain
MVVVVCYDDRFRLIMADPLNAMIPRCETAGQSYEFNGQNWVVMHNGLKVLMGEAEAYYANFAQILTINKGCHEPSEEFVFAKVLDRITAAHTDKSRRPTMIELGAYWSFYTMWFQRTTNGLCVVAEPEPQNLEVGIKNVQLNAMTSPLIKFVHGGVNFPGAPHLKVPELIATHLNGSELDILHSDIQGQEFAMLQECEELLQAKRIKYLFVSTHSAELHRQCTELLTRCGYRADIPATYCFDGILVATCDPTFPSIDLPDRRAHGLA